MKRYIRIIYVVVAVLIIGLGYYLFTSDLFQRRSSRLNYANNNNVKINKDVEIFVNNADFPKPQEVNVLLNIPEHDTQVFQIRYGDQICVGIGFRTDCWYKQAIGLLHKDKINWLSVQDDINQSDELLYNFNANDAYLFSEEFHNRLQMEGNSVFRNDFLALQARDPDTPRGTLLRIAQTLPSASPNLAVVDALIENPQVATDEEILLILDNLDYRTSMYDSLQDLLDGLK